MVGLAPPAIFRGQSACAWSEAKKMAWRLENIVATPYFAPYHPGTGMEEEER